MKYSIKTTNSFEKDLKRLKKGEKNLKKLREIVSVISSGAELAAKFRVHKLSGNWLGSWECHIEPDWLLIWYYGEDHIILERTGGHANLFK